MAYDKIQVPEGEKITVNEIIGMINAALGKDIEPVYVPSRPGDVKHSLADITAARELIAEGHMTAAEFPDFATEDGYRDPQTEFIDNITFDGNGNTINGETEVVLTSDYGALTFRYNGTEWEIR